MKKTEFPTQCCIDSIYTATCHVWTNLLFAGLGAGIRNDQFGTYSSMTPNFIFRMGTSASSLGCRHQMGFWCFSTLVLKMDIRGLRVSVSHDLRCLTRNPIQNSAKRKAGPYIWALCCVHDHAPNRTCYRSPLEHQQFVLLNTRLHGDGGNTIIKIHVCEWVCGRQINMPNIHRPTFLVRGVCLYMKSLYSKPNKST